MYGKIEKGVLVEAPKFKLLADGRHCFGYNLDSNAEMLLADGYKPVRFVNDPEQFVRPLERVSEVGEFIEVCYSEGEVVPVLGYAELRAAEYPDVGEYLDAQVKLGSGDPALAEEGATQLNGYFQACLAVKAKYPKPDADIL